MPDAHTLLWFSVALLAYTYAGYPLLVRLWASFKPQQAVTGWMMPRLTLVVVAYNESQRIRQRLENFLDLDYPWDHLEVIVACDGCTDDTAEQARAYHSTYVRVMEFKKRRGKSAVLNDVMRLARSEIVVLADARQRFETGALRALASRFADPQVGAVSGELILLDGSSHSEVGKGVDFYWRYEKFMRLYEGQIDSTVGVTGAIYAMRKQLFRPIPEALILDDVLIPMQVVRQGYRVLFEPKARAYDWVVPTAQQEFTRKLRTIAGNFQLFFLRPWLLSPAHNRLWVQTVSHKLFRLLSPLLLAIAFVANLALAGDPAYRALLAAQMLFYGAALLGYLTRHASRKPFFLNIPYAFCLLNWATVMALVHLLNGRQQVTWERTAT
ncbi:MAG TPA: glycosyltransferase family 2 protein [Gammaproteobacteria bacterium]|jgi:cellulose synthase/poly-beta-1,6-N-acetylglucosamine synthase-like glycosyltransferase